MALLPNVNNNNKNNTPELYSTAAAHTPRIDRHVKSIRTYSGFHFDRTPPLGVYSRIFGSIMASWKWNVMYHPSVYRTHTHIIRIKKEIDFENPHLIYLSVRIVLDTCHIAGHRKRLWTPFLWIIRITSTTWNDYSLTINARTRVHKIGDIYN